MTDPGWDIPGLPREPAATGEPAAPDSTPGLHGTQDGSGPSRRARAAHPLVSVSVLAPAGSPGAFGRSAGAGPGSTPPDSAPSDTTAPDSTATGSAPPGSTAADSAASDSTPPPSTAADSAASEGSTASGGTASDGTASDGTASGGTASDGGAAAGGFAGGAAEAIAQLSAALDYLAHADAALWPEGLQADCLRALAVAESRQAAVHARVLAAFSVPGGGLNGDGHRSPRMWLTWQTRATRAAAATHTGWMRRLAAHPRTGAALAAGVISLSWARQLADWSDLLPEEHRDDADRVLLAGAASGAALPDLAAAAQELLARHASPDTDDGFEDRRVRVTATLDGTGRVDGDLTARCAAALTAVLDSLSGRRGPEDTRTLAQRHHDAIEEACLRLIASDCLPQRAGQPVRLELVLTLDQLAAGGAGSPAGPGGACDAAIQPVVTGRADHGLLNRLTDPRYQAGLRAAAAGRARDDQFSGTLAQAIALLSGPAGHAAVLRRRLTGIPAAAVSLPLDIAGTLDTIPAHLRRAVKHRDRHCRFPGCDMPPAGCDVHHITHRKDGGRHALTNTALLCRFHHLIAIHRWGWQFTLHPDGTTTATSPDGTKTLHSHAPPVKAA